MTTIFVLNVLYILENSLHLTKLISDPFLVDDSETAETLHSKKSETYSHTRILEFLYEARQTPRITAHGKLGAMRHEESTGPCTSDRDPSLDLRCENRLPSQNA